MKNKQELLHALQDAVSRNDAEDVCSLLKHQKISLEIQVVAASLNIVGSYLEYIKADDDLKKYLQEMIVDFGQLVFGNSHTFDSVPQSGNKDVLFEHLTTRITIMGAALKKICGFEDITHERKTFDLFVKTFIQSAILFMFAVRKTPVFFVETAKKTEPLKIFDSLLEIRAQPGRVRKQLQAPQDDEVDTSDSESTSSESPDMPAEIKQTSKPVNQKFINELKQPLLLVLQNEITRISSSKHWLYKEVDTNRKLQALSNVKNKVEPYNSTDIPAFKTFVKDLTNTLTNPDLYLKRRTVFSLSSSATQSNDTESYQELSKAINMLDRS